MTQSSENKSFYSACEQGNNDIMIKLITSKVHPHIQSIIEGFRILCKHNKYNTIDVLIQHIKSSKSYNSKNLVEILNSCIRSCITYESVKMMISHGASDIPFIIEMIVKYV